LNAYLRHAPIMESASKAHSQIVLLKHQSAQPWRPTLGITALYGGMK